MIIPNELKKCYDLGLTMGGIYFTDFCWRKFEELNDPPYYDFIHPGVMEFGFSARRDLWFLFNDWKQYTEPVVIKFCQGSDCSVYSQSYRDFIVRMTIEEFNSTWYFEDAKQLPVADSMFRQYPEKIRRVVGDEYADALARLIQNKKLKLNGANGVPGYLSNEEMELAIKSMIPSSILNQRVQLDVSADDYDFMRFPIQQQPNQSLHQSP